MTVSLTEVEPAVDRTWRDDAACQRLDVRVFFPAGEDPVLLARAKAVCAECPVITVCLEAGLRETEGVWGGKSPKERAALLRKRRRS